MTKAQRAKQMFDQGYNCGQAILGVYAEELNLDMNTAMAIASCTGGGLARTRNVCGACIGMCMAAGLAVGYTSPDAVEQKTQTYAFMQGLLKDFEKENGSTICKVLLGLESDTGSYSCEKRPSECNKKRPCNELVASAVEILERALEEKKKDK